MTDSVKHTSPCVAYTGKDGNIFTFTPTTGKKCQLTWSWGAMERRGKEPVPLTYVWPTWAPDGDRLACFGVRGTAEKIVETNMYAVASDGIESWELAGLSKGMPIYGNWSPRTDAFAALIQRGEHLLSLETVSLTHLGKTTALVSGAPLFWSWSPRGDMLAVHVGGSRQASAEARVVLLDAVSGQIVREVSRQPGEFRVPVWSPQDDLVTYVEQGTDGENILRLFDVASGEIGPVTTTNGATAALWSPDGRSLAFGCSTQPDSFVFSFIKVLDLATGRIASLLEEPVIGFFWSPPGDALFYLSVDVQRSHLCWHRLKRTSGEKTTLARFLPSREQTLIFSFFDQYALSHPPLAPDGSALAFAGHLIGTSALETTAPAQIYVVPLDPPALPKPVAPGQVVCWSP